MATDTPTRTRSKQRPADEEEQKTAPAPADPIDDEDEDDEDEDDEDELGTAEPSGAAASDFGDDDDLEDDDDDDSIIIGEGWEEAEAPSGDFPIVDKGIYTVALVDTDVRKPGEQSKTGLKYGVLVFKIRPEDNEDVMEETASTVTIWQNLFFSAKAMGRSKKFAADMGVTVRKGDNIMRPLAELAEDETLFKAVVGFERFRADDENTGKTVNKRRNKILRIIEPVEA